MATYEKLSSKLKIVPYDFDPDTSGQVDVGWQDMRGFNSFMAVLSHSVGTGDVNEFKILVNTAADGSGTETTLKSHALGSQPDAQGDYIFLECTSEEIAGLDDNMRGISAAVGLNTATDEAVVIYIMGGGHEEDGLTSEYIS